MCDLRTTSKSFSKKSSQCQCEVWLPTLSQPTLNSRIAVSEVWNEIQDQRRERSPEMDPLTAERLAKHDTENDLG